MDEFLTNLEKFARANKIPVVLPDTREFLCNLCREIKPKSILEIGMAIGFSGSNMLRSYEGSRLTCLEASTPNIAMARENFMAQNLLDRVEIIEGDCMNTLPTLAGRKFDLIFLDGPKSKYIEMIDMILPLLDIDGVWVSDNVLFRGMVRDGAPVTEPRFARTAHALDEFLVRLETNDKLDTKIEHIGDGLSIVKFKRDKL